MTAELLSPIWASGARELCNHLWQSTLFVVIVALLALLLRKNQARIRYRLWMAASVKFLIPFSLLISLQSHLPWPSHALVPKATAYVALEAFSQPFPQGAPRNTPIAIPVARSTASHVPIPILPSMLIAVWLTGFLTRMSFWCLQWRRISRLVPSQRPSPGSAITYHGIECSLPAIAGESSCFQYPITAGIPSRTAAAI